MAGELHEVFLDALVLEVVDLEILKKYPLEARAAAFLKELGYAQKLAYICKTLEEKLTLNPMPDGQFYVITPEEGFIYKKQGDSVLEVEAANGLDYGNGRLSDILVHLQRLA